MASPSFVQALTAALSPHSRVLTDERSTEFKKSMDRWTNYGLKTPSAIVQPATEDDVVTTVKKLVDASIPFVPAASGHWASCSSIGKDGVIIDLSRFTGVEVDEARSLATVKGGTLMKEFQTTLHSYKHFAAVASASIIGVIPYYIGGGISAYSPFCGYGCENIVAARFVNAKGELVEVSGSDPDDAELLWGLRGAGQFLGLFTQITVKLLPYSVMGSADGQCTTGTFVFSVDKLDAVAAVLAALMKKGREFVSAGRISVVQASPDFRRQVLLVAPQVFVDVGHAVEIFQPLVDLGPIMEMVAPSAFDKHGDHMDSLCAKGGFKRFTQNGMTGFSVDNFRRLVELHGELVSTCPDAARSEFSVEWYTPCKEEHIDTAFGMGEVEMWLNIVSWYHDAKNHAYVESVDRQAQQIGRAGDLEDDYVSYTNTCRDDHLEWRYKGQDRRNRLKALKKQWDPMGIFTRELL